MRTSAFGGPVAAAAAITAALYLPTAAWAEDVVIKRVDGGEFLVVQDEASQDEDEEVEVLALPSQGEHWIGVKLVSLSDALRAQLDLPEKAGVVIGTVFPDSPAEKAGMRKYDIILSSGDRPIREGAEMVELVVKANGDELPLTVLRKGEPVELTVTPAERPGLTVYTPGIDNDGNAGVLSLDNLTGTHEYRIIRPGVVLAHPDNVRVRLPMGMRLRVERDGGKPARITVDRNDEHWEVTEEELDELPADVREHVERHLGHPLGARRFAFEAPVQRGLSWLKSQRRDGEESDDGEGDDGGPVWQELEEGGPLPREFSLDRAMEQIESIREQFEGLADEQAERTEGLIEEKGEELEETLNDRVTRLEEMLTNRADQLRDMIQSFFSDNGSDEEVEIETEEGDDDADADAVNEGEAEVESEEEDEVEVEIELELDANSDAV